MLVLTRKKDESIRIGDDIVIKVIRTGKGHIKIGVDAPQHIRVVREELLAGLEAVAADEEDAPAADEDEYPVIVSMSDAEAMYAGDCFPHPHVA